MGFDSLELAYSLFKIQFIILVAGVATLTIISDKIKPLIASIGVITITLITSVLAIIGIANNGIEILIYSGSFLGYIPFRIDALSAWFMLIINLVTSTGVVYGIGYLKAYKPVSSVNTMHWVLFLLFQSSMLWVCMAQNSIAFIVAWEIMSLSSLLLVLFEHNKQQVLKAGINYLVQMHLSVVSLTVAFIWVYFNTGTFDFNGISTYFGTNTNIWLFIVFFVGFGFKAGFLGLHTWLPHAHPAAPSHVSGVMSGVIVKMGIYGIFRIISYLKADYVLLGELILGLSLFTGVFGIMNAAVHRDFKKMLAYCTIENIGIIGIGIGLGLIGLGKDQSLLCFLGFGGALLHVLNHSLFKSLLFYSAGSVYQQTHTRDMDQLGGLIKKMPKTAIIFLIGAIAIGGIPPFNGFISEFIIYCGLLNGFTSAGITQIVLMVLSFAGLSVIGGVSILTFTKTFGTIFLGSPRKELKHEPHEVSKLMLVPQYLTIAVMLLVAFMPAFFINLVATILNGSFGVDMQVNQLNLQYYSGILSSISLYSFLFILVIGIVYYVRYYLTKNNETTYSPTWGCGYVAPNSKMQYTGKSFSKMLGKLSNFMIIEKKNYKELVPSEIFPQSRTYFSFYFDFFEVKLINPAMQLLRKFINVFQFVQNGKIQAYVVYGIVFIVVVFIGTVLNILY